MSIADAPSDRDDAMSEFRHEGWVFLCGAERLADGRFHATLRCRMPPTHEIRTLQFDEQRFSAAVEAVSRAREMARQWASSHSAAEGGRR